MRDMQGGFPHKPEKAEGRAYYAQLEAAISTGPGTTLTDNYTLQTSDTSKFFVLNNSSACKILTVAAPAGYNSEHRNTFYNAGSRGWRFQVSPMPEFILWPNQSLILHRHASSAWAILAKPNRWKTQSPTLYVAPPGGTNRSANNDGLGSDAPLDTLDTAVGMVAGNQFDVHFFSQPGLTIRMMDGTHTSGLHMPSSLKPSAGNETMHITGNSSNPNAVTIADPAAPAFGFFNDAWVNISNMVLAGGAGGIAVRDVARARILNGITFGAMLPGYAHIIAIGGLILPSTFGGSQSYSISGGADYHIQCLRGSAFVPELAWTINFTANAAFSQKFILVDEMSTVDFGPITINLNAHTITGTRYAASRKALLTTPGFSGNGNDFPGSAAGSVDASS